MPSGWTSPTTSRRYSATTDRSGIGDWHPWRTDTNPPRRGEIYWADLDPARGSEQAGHRPVR
ncbi:type II toxin-antitoxin system PemK/MazF family toxin [Rhodococcus sp. DMF-1]|uniref:type II toxin-antitoxin system PemK/MazF family toxin n=1 Tax=Rhodococcus sp. DMF-1 TaxID=2907624 RepID=UPI003FA3BB75